MYVLLIKQFPINIPNTLFPSLSPCGRALVYVITLNGVIWNEVCRLVFVHIVRYFMYAVLAWRQGREFEFFHFENFYEVETKLKYQNKLQQYLRQINLQIEWIVSCNPWNVYTDVSGVCPLSNSTEKLFFTEILVWKNKKLIGSGKPHL